MIAEALPIKAMKQFWKTDAVTSWEKMKCTQKSTFLCDRKRKPLHKKA